MAVLAVAVATADGSNDGCGLAFPPPPITNLIEVMVMLWADNSNRTFIIVLVLPGNNAQVVYGIIASCYGTWKGGR